MSKLISRVRAHTSGQVTSGQNTLALLVECIEHMFGESGDWSPLAYLIGKSEPAQSRAVRRLTGCLVHGWTLKADADQPSGLRFAKREKANQGVDLERLNVLRAMVEGKKSIQSKEVSDLFKPVSEEKSTDEVLKEAAKRYVLRMKKENVAFSAIVSAVEAAIKEAQIDTSVKGIVAAL